MSKLPPQCFRVRTLGNLRLEAKKIEAVHLAAALMQSDWRLRPAAKMLGIALSEIVRLIDSYGLREVYAEHSHPAGRPKKEPK